MPFWINKLWKKIYNKNIYKKIGLIFRKAEGINFIIINFAFKNNIIYYFKLKTEYKKKIKKKFTLKKKNNGELKRICKLWVKYGRIQFK